MVIVMCLFRSSSGSILVLLCFASSSTYFKRPYLILPPDLQVYTTFILRLSVFLIYWMYGKV
ncbi:hypothetical protein SLEP1_g57043 [Rubroshorea leprosula]|uniref:Uncharacterized protein n=1 Tax=Rubroshorea leprosula TaxID=152421 RepID=A0AAV5MKA8_9ROSI|nr:hypothetical protein SLEP1_g57043 [Rubroshorea leprosula]